MVLTTPETHSVETQGGLSMQNHDNPGQVVSGRRHGQDGTEVRGLQRGCSRFWTERYGLRNTRWSPRTAGR
jgi:hypothetical protein